MLEIPECVTLANQLCSLSGKTIVRAEANHSPHKFTWYNGDPANYSSILEGKSLGTAYPVGGYVSWKIGENLLLFQDGVSLRLLPPGSREPKKHQLLLKLNDGSQITASVQMYGGILLYPPVFFDNLYYQRAQEAPSPLHEDFDFAYFEHLFDNIQTKTLSAKAFLATKQRIPGLGNGVLQDILFYAHVHPKRDVLDLSKQERADLFRSTKETLLAMTNAGGRNTEKDLFGLEGGYRTILSKFTVGTPCPSCGATIEKGSYLGGSIYFCPCCQPLC